MMPYKALCVQTLCAGSCAAEMRAWALRVACPNSYLEFPDVLLYAVKKKFPLQVLLWKQGLFG